MLYMHVYDYYIYYLFVLYSLLKCGNVNYEKR